MRQQLKIKEISETTAQLIENISQPKQIDRGFLPTEHDKLSELQPTKFKLFIFHWTSRGFDCVSKEMVVYPKAPSSVLPRSHPLIS